MSIDNEAWTTLNRVKLHLHVGLSDTTKDAFLEQLINSAYKSLEGYIGYQLYQKVYTEYYDGMNDYKLVLRKCPVVSVTSLWIDWLREFGDSTLANPADYYTDLELGTIEFFSHLNTGPGWFVWGRKNIKVIYTAGWSTIPADAAEACDEYVSFLFNRSGTEGFTQQSMGAKSEAYDLAPIPDFIKWKLSKYRNWGV